MTELVIGLGSIGAAVANNLINNDYTVAGFEIDPTRAREWATENNSLAVSSPNDIDWKSVETIHIAVRMASHLENVLTILRSNVHNSPTVVVLTTLAPSDAKRILKTAPSDWRVFEAPLSGGPQRAADGSMTLMLAGPEPTPVDLGRFADMAKRRFWTDNYGDPAMLKLLNNTLGAYNALSTSAMLRIATNHGVSAKQFLDLVNVSSGQSWMSSNFDNFDYSLLFKDAGLLIDDVEDTPTISLSNFAEHEMEIEAARRILFK